MTTTSSDRDPSSSPKSSSASQNDLSRSAVFSGEHKIQVSSAYLQALYQRLSIATVLIPFLGTVLAVSLLSVRSVGMSELILFAVMYALSVLGVEVGYHRLLAHRAFETSAPIRAALAILGGMAAQGGCLFWVAHHRRHHQFTDQPEDPHSPNLCGSHVWGRLQGLWHAQMGWVIAGNVTNSAVFAKDLLKDSLITRINRLQHLWVLIGLGLPALLNFVISRGSWMAAFYGFLWGGLVRVFIAQQVVNATNSICHVYGARPFNCGDQSTNNFFLALPSAGQSWHNNHHAFPNSAIAGLHWWQVDPSTWLIRILAALGLAWNVRSPSQQSILSKATLNKAFNKALNKT